jgi:hypothetical protein
MRPQSAKAKGRRHQQDVCKALVEVRSDLEPDDIRSTSMGALGEDVLFSPAARRIYPYSIECKNVEKINIWEAIDQARSNAGKYTPAVAFSKNNEEIWMAIPLKDFLRFFNNKENVNE